MDKEEIHAILNNEYTPQEEPYHRCKICGEINYERLGKMIVKDYYCNNCLKKDSDYFEAILENIIQQTFHQTDENARKIVDSYIKSYPELLLVYPIDYLYRL